MTSPFRRWFINLLGGQNAARSLLTAGNKAQGNVTDAVELRHESHVVPYDEQLLERARNQWLVGDWEGLAAIPRDVLQHHPDRAKIALLVAAGMSQNGHIEDSRQFTNLALDWGCPQKLVRQILISGVHNTLGRANALAGLGQKLLPHFEKAVRIGAPQISSEVVIQARANVQLGLNASFNQISDISLIRDLKIKRIKIAAKDNHSKLKTWTAIICMWRRIDYIENQLNAIKNQTTSPAEIMIIVNENNINIEWLKNLAGSEVKIIVSDINSLYTRWALSYVAKGEYVCVFDDDTIPASGWIEYAIEKSIQYNAMVGPSGRIYSPGGKEGFFKLVGPSKSKEDPNTIDCSTADTHCDWICNSYLYKRAWVPFALMEPRYLGEHKTYDDMQLAFSMKNYGGINCIVPKQTPEENNIGSMNPEYGSDEHAIWKTNQNAYFEKRKTYARSLFTTRNI